jgi:hypothetical protein
MKGYVQNSYRSGEAPKTYRSYGSGTLLESVQIERLDKKGGRGRLGNGQREDLKEGTGRNSKRVQNRSKECREVNKKWSDREGCQRWG